MPLSDFDKAVTFTLGWEGPYENDPDDPGGETAWGICKRSYPNLDIASLTREDAIEIYRKDYWEAAGCPLWPWPDNLVLFDSSVNCGVSRACMWMGVSDTYKDMLLHRIRHYARLRKPKYIQGWINRTVALWEYAIQERK